ncbi:MAG: hypothetical protein ACFFCW_00770 [Candidatus Hodarchaeota archaeon]
MMTKIFHVIKGELQEENTSEFYNGDVYIVDAGMKIWVWTGSKSSVDEKFAGAFISKQMDLERRDFPKLLHVDEGNEPPEFLALLPGVLQIREGGETGILVPPPEQPKHKPKLYRIDSESGQTYEVPLRRESLDGEDSFVLDAGMKIWIWRGSQSTVMEKFDAAKMGRDFDAERAYEPDTEVIEEGDEPSQFWKHFE